MNTVEKNDVDISQIFNWGRVYEIVGSNGEVEGIIYMRLLGDADVNRARTYALRKSAELRRSLRDENSDEYLTTIKDFEDIDEETLLNYVVAFSVRDIRNQAIKEVKVKKPKQPKSDASLEDMEKFQKEVDEYPEKMGEAIKKVMEKKVEELTKVYKKKSKEELYTTYKSKLTDELCEMTATRAYKDMEIFLGCYKDENYEFKFFDSFEQYDNLLTDMKVNLRRAYDTLSFSMDDLKKLREATQ